MAKSSRTSLTVALAAVISGFSFAGASAATYISYFSYKNSAPNTVAPNPYGTITITEVNAHQIDAVVQLLDPTPGMTPGDGLVGFINTGNHNVWGGNKQPFSFSLTSAYNVTVSNYLPGQEFVAKARGVDGNGVGRYQNNNFGMYTNAIWCCHGAQGGGNYDASELRFSVTNSGPETLTFANTFASNAGGWWFSADVTTLNGSTFNIAARDAIVVPGVVVPEPLTWALMVMGFGGAGALLRRRRPAAV